MSATPPRAWRTGSRPAGAGGRVTYDARKARAWTSALKTLARAQLGVWLLVLIALGFAAFGVFCFFQARYREV